MNRLSEHIFDELNVWASQQAIYNILQPTTSIDMHPWSRMIIFMIQDFLDASNVTFLHFWWNYHLSNLSDHLSVMYKNYQIL